jgi:hypothetical protein
LCYFCIDIVILSIATLMREDEKVASVLDILFKILNLCWSEVVLWCCNYKQVRLLDFFKVHCIFIKADLWLHKSYLIALFVFLYEFLQVRPWVAHFLFANVKDYLIQDIRTTFWLLIDTLN